MPLRYTTPQAAQVEQIVDFGLVDESTGWVVFGDRLYRTAEAGEAWDDITPSLTGQGIETVNFIDPASGWLIARQAGSPTLQLFVTADAGAAWDAIPLETLNPAAAGIEAVFLFRLNLQTAWIVLKAATGINFSSGRLFHTADGGHTWRELNIPIGEPVYFVDEELGWTAGGAAGDQLLHTTDGGLTWQAVRLPAAGIPSDAIVRFKLPRFVNPSDGMLPVLVRDGTGTSVWFFETRDAGVSWTPSANISPVDAPEAIDFSFFLFKDSSFLLRIPNTRFVIRGNYETGISGETSPGPLTAGIESIEMITRRMGWAKYSRAECTPEGDGRERSCVVETRLLFTVDGADNWSTLDLPGNDPGFLSERFDLPSRNSGGGSAPLAPASSNTLTLTGQGFDKCEIGTLPQMQSWWANSPYSAVNLYIGGSARACSNNALNSSFLRGLQRQGWRFIPTWVGPQASCTGYSSRMSADPAEAYLEGVAEADAAVDISVDLGLALPDGSGTVIYYDLEAYNTSNTGCREAANSFISGWTTRLQSTGNLAGVYGASCASDLTGIANLTPSPDVVWIANWVESTYTPDASVWNAVCLSNTYWASHQRLRQYTGPHNETWGGTTLYIDSSVLDGVVTRVNVPDHIRNDFDGDGDTDIGVYRPVNNGWYIRDQITNFFGASGDIPLPNDWDGDGDTDAAVFRPSNQSWYIKDQFALFYGLAGDIPVPGDYDGDGDTDVAVYRPSNSTWYVKDQFALFYGLMGDIPMPRDYDGDGDTDIAVFRPSNNGWYVRNQFTVFFGTGGDIPVPADYDGDGDEDVAVYRPSNSSWYIKDQTSLFYGLAGDLPMPGDYDGDGDMDIAVYRPSNSTWYARDLLSLYYGLAGDFPLPARDTNADGDPYQ